MPKVQVPGQKPILTKTPKAPKTPKDPKIRNTPNTSNTPGIFRFPQYQKKK